MRDAWEPMRQAGAIARAMLIAAGTQRLGVAAVQRAIESGKVVHSDSGRSLGFGELAAEAAALPMPKNIKLKDRSEFLILGTPQARLDIPEKVDGSAMFGLDARPKGMVYAAIRHAPVFDGRVEKIDSHAAREMPGVRTVIELPATSMSNAAVAVVADHYRQAKKALEKVSVTWDDGEHAAHDTDVQQARYCKMIDSDEGRVYDAAGDIDPVFADATKTLESKYFAPYLAHATMEPINCTAVVRADETAEVWTGNQGPPFVRSVMAKAAGIHSAGVTVHTPYLSGGFGRRSEMDVVMQVGQIATQMRDTPVRLIWSREEDIQHDLYRPMGAATMRAAFGPDGRFEGFESKIVGQSCISNLVSRLLSGMESNLMKDRTLTEGVFDVPYDVPNRRVAHVLAEEPVPVGFSRSVGHSHHAFFAEAFIDECAEAAGKGAYEFRHALLAHAPRHQKVLETAAQAASWGSLLPDGVARGIAPAESFGSSVAQVAEVELNGDDVRVRRVTCAIDCGFAVNPDTVAAQMESGIIFELTAALFGEITVKGGRVQ